MNKFTNNINGVNKMAEIQSKIVRTVAPAGVTVNFTGITGNNHQYYPCAVSLIKLMLERNVLVYEKLAEPAEDGSTEVQLTLENFNQDNSGEAVEEGAHVIPNLEEQIANQHAKEREAFLEEKGQEIKEKQQVTHNTFFNIIDQTPTEETEDITREEILALFGLTEETYAALQEAAAGETPDSTLLSTYGLTSDEYTNMTNMLSNKG